MSAGLRGRWSTIERGTRLTYAVTMLALIVLIIHILVLQTLPDDAFISFRYAHNLAQGHGPVFNPGQPVEGYTSPLWVFLLGGLATLGLPIAETAIVLCITSAVLTVAFLPRFTRLLGSQIYGLPALLLALNTSYAIWAGSAMEMVPFGLLLLVTTWALLNEKPPLPTGLLFALLSLLRPEGMLFGGLALLFGLVNALRGKERGWQYLLRLGLAFGLPVAAHMAWRLTYYGYPLPNAFYAKVGFSLDQCLRGLRYTAEAALHYWLALTIPLGLGLLRPLGRKWAFLAVGLGLYLLYVSLVGGDWMVSYRLVVPVLPFAVVLAACSLVGTWRRLQTRLRPRWAQILALTGLLLVLSNSVYASFTTEPEQLWVRDAKPIADWLNNHCPTDKKLAVFAAGALPYYAPDFEIVDMFGLNEVEIAHKAQPHMGGGYAAHEKFDTDLILKREPDMFIFQPVLGDHAITEVSEWREGGLGHLVRQFTDNIKFWATHSTQTAPMPEGRHFNFVIRNPYFCR